MTPMHMLSSCIPVAWNPAWNRLTSRCPQIQNNQLKLQKSLQPFWTFQSRKHRRPWNTLAAYLHSCKTAVLNEGVLDKLLTQSTFTMEKLSWYQITFYDTLLIDWQSLVEAFLFKTTLIFFPLEEQFLPQISPGTLFLGSLDRRGKTFSKRASIILTQILPNSQTAFFWHTKYCFYISPQTILKLRSLQ